MAKNKTQYTCTNCGAISPKWQGQCPECQNWNTLQESFALPDTSHKRQGFAGGNSSVIKNLVDVKNSSHTRFNTGLKELDRVLGNGLTKGSVVLLGGDPGIGKSTILIQVMSNLAKNNHKTLYLTGEESEQQVKDRGERLNLFIDTIRIGVEIELEAILDILSKEKPEFVVIDSIQTMYTNTMQSAPGNVAQVRECAAMLTRFAKINNVTVLIIGHVTKEGSLAGPRVLEHIVDTVLYFEGDKQASYRMIRAIKNRFGPVNEMGVFAMTEKGLQEIENPSALFLSPFKKEVPGCCVSVLQEGNRPMLVEIQALVEDSHTPNSRRLAVGIDNNRLNMLVALLQKTLNVSVAEQNIYLNVVGGLKITDTSADLACIMAIVSSLRGKPYPKDIAVLAEMGLTGEVRPVPHTVDRVKEAIKLGFKKIIVSKHHMPDLNSLKIPVDGVDLVGVEYLSYALQAAERWIQNS